MHTLTRDGQDDYANTRHFFISVDINDETTISTFYQLSILTNLENLRLGSSQWVTLAL